MTAPVVAAAVTAVTAVLLAGLPLAHGRQGAGARASGSFTKEQAQRGKALYDARCASCHGPDLVGQQENATDLTGLGFRLAWLGKPLADRYDLLRTTMPPGQPGMLTDQQYLDIVTYILSFNRYPAGSTELKPDAERLEQIVIEPLPAASAGGGSPGAPGMDKASGERETSQSIDHRETSERSATRTAARARAGSRTAWEGE